MIDCTKRKVRIYFEEPVVRNTDAILNKNEDIVVCLPRARFKHVTDIIQTEYIHEHD